MKTTIFTCSNCGTTFKKAIDGYENTGVGTERYDVCPKCESGSFEQKSNAKITKKELKQYVLLKKEIEKEQDQLNKLKEKNEDCAELIELIENNKLRCMALLLKTEQFIYSIDHTITRQIFEARYIKGMTWAGVSNAMGGYLTADYVRILHDRYLKK